MISQSILDLLKNHKLLDASVELPSDWDETQYEGAIKDELVDLLNELIPQRIVYYGDMTELPGFVNTNDPGGDYAELIKSYAKASQGEFKITALRTIESEEDETTTISFKDGKKKHELSLDLEDPGEYFWNLTNWAYSALGGNVLFIGDESFHAFCVPKAFVKALAPLGITSDTDYFGPLMEVESAAPQTEQAASWAKAIKYAQRHAKEYNFGQPMIISVLCSDAIGRYQNSTYIQVEYGEVWVVSKKKRHRDADPSLMLSEVAKLDDERSSDLHLSYCPGGEADCIEEYINSKGDGLERALSFVQRYLPKVVA